jgi:NADPH:quinone reductase-like Zn-dependent oxidoreductase
VGDKVFSETGNRGSFADYVAANEANVVTMPTNVDFLTAAGVPMAGLTALQGLRDYCKAKEGSKVSAAALFGVLAVSALVSHAIV